MKKPTTLEGKLWAALGLIHDIYDEYIYYKPTEQPVDGTPINNIQALLDMELRLKADILDTIIKYNIHLEYTKGSGYQIRLPFYNGNDTVYFPTLHDVYNALVEFEQNNKHRED